MRRGCVVVAALLFAPRPAHAYEFWLDAREYGQLYDVRDAQLVGPDLILGRHRFTTTLSLRIFDVGDFSRSRRIARLPDRGLRVSWQSYLRVDHDFGDYTGGTIRFGTVRRDAIDVIPELVDSEISLQLLYGYLQLDGLADDRLRLQLGRVLADDGWGTGAIDGADARYELPNAPLAVSASAGLRVRAASPLGVSAFELDGTSGAGCQEYVEGPTPGSGSWQLIDRNRAITNNPTTSDFEYCPQREVRQPSIGVAIATARVRNFGAELGYRRTWSDTVGLIGAVDRLDFPDLGLYPNDFGQAPSSGVNEERVWARVHAQLQSGAVSIQPYADARYSILNAALDRADAGVRVQDGVHSLEPAVGYYFPTFDGDSIFNAFAIDPALDARLDYRYGARAYAGAWVRKYSEEDGASEYAGGGTIGVMQKLGAHWKGKLDGLADTGYGGNRVGGTAEVAWQAQRWLWLRGRQIVLRVREDDLAYRASRKVVTSSSAVTATWRVSDGVGLHGIVEVDRDGIHDELQTRLLAVLDLNFTPEIH